MDPANRGKETSADNKTAGIALAIVPMFRLLLVEPQQIR
jgi:hypothetical protein